MPLGTQAFASNAHNTNLKRLIKACHATVAFNCHVMMMKLAVVGICFVSTAYAATGDGEEVVEEEAPIEDFPDRSTIPILSPEAIEASFMFLMKCEHFSQRSFYYFLPFLSSPHAPPSASALPSAPLRMFRVISAVACGLGSMYV